MKMRLLALFIVGLLVGAVITTFSIGHLLDSAYLERKALQNKVVELQDTIEGLEKALSEQRQHFLRIEQIKVSIIDPPDAFAALDLEEEILSLLTDLIGKELDTVDLRLVHNMLDDRLLEVGNKRFKLTVQGIQLYREAEVLLKAEQIIDDPVQP